MLIDCGGCLLKITGPHRNEMFNKINFYKTIALEMFHFLKKNIKNHVIISKKKKKHPSMNQGYIGKHLG